MNKLLSFLFLIVFFALMSFTSKDTTPAKTNLKASYRLLEAKIAAIPFNEQISIPLSGTIANNCTGQRMDVVSGTIHTVIRGVVNDNRMSFGYTSNAQNVTLVAADGAVYHGNGVYTGSFNGSLNGTSFTVKEEIRFLLATAGKGNNTGAKISFHLTVNANGEVTAEVEDVTLFCR
jgi:hypothetical protein